MTGPAPGLLLLAGAALAWPAPRPLARLGATPARHRNRPPAGWWAPPAAAATLAAGAPVALAAMLIAATAVHLIRGIRRRRRREAELADLAAVAEALAAGLRAGAPAPAALTAAAGGIPGPVGAAVARAAARARLGGSAAAELAAAGIPGLRGLAAAWALAEAHGLPLAGIAEGVRADAAGRAAHRSRVSAALAGPRTTIAILAALPAAGLAMGAGLGADPVGFLTAGPGAAVLLAGVGLGCAGVVWAGRILDGAREPR